MSGIAEGDRIIRPRLLYLVAEDWFFWSHFRAFAFAAQDVGCEVFVATRVQDHGELIEEAGFHPIPIGLRRKSRNPIRELSAIAELTRVYRAVRPSLVHHVAIKPVLYGSAAAYLAGVPTIVDTFAGLGYVFVSSGIRAFLRKRLVCLAYRLALRFRNLRAIFENPESRDTFVENRLITAEKAALIRGAGADLSEFAMRPEPEGVPVVMHAGRLLWDKGVGDLVDAARLLKQRGVSCRVVLVGVPDTDNPRAIPEEMLRNWVGEGLIEWWGKRNDMPTVLAGANLLALPSVYGEGVPKILLEAAAVGRAIVATDIPGCREVVRHRVNGLLVPPHDVSALADALGELIQDPETRTLMGRRGRKIAEAEFSTEQIVAETLDTYHQLLGGQWPGEKQVEILARKAA